MKKITFMLFAIFTLSFSWQGIAQLTCTQTFTVSGQDDDPTILTINSTDLTCNGAQAIQSLQLVNPAGSLTSGFCTTDASSWFGFDLAIDGGTAVPSCGADFNNVDITGFTTLTITSHDDDDWSDGITITIDVEVTYETPSCQDPIDMTVSSLTSSSVDLTWSASPSNETAWNIEWNADADFTPGNGEEDAADAVSGTAAYNATGLSPNTTYYIYYQADCGGGDTSAWVGPFTFTTACEAFAIPFTETFDSDSVSENCWAVLNENGDTDAWDTNYTSDVITGDENAALNTDFNSGNNDDWLISPTITLTGNERLKFKYSLQSTGEPNDFEVLLSTSGTDIASFTNTILPLASYNDVDIDNSESTELTVDLSSYTGDVNVAWRVPPGGLDGWRLYIDDVVFESIPSCLEPTALTVTDITATSADLGWTENGTASVWNIEIVDLTAGDAATGVATDTGVSNPFTASGLTPNNEYAFYVQADCGDGTSEWIGPFTFLTYGDCSSSGTYDYANNFDASNSVGFVANTPGDYITITFTAGSTETCCDDWFIMDAADGTGNVIATGAGDITGSYESITGEISFYVDSDGSVTGTTFEYSLSCAPPPACPDPTALTVTDITATSADLGWTEGGTESLWNIEIVDLTAGDAATGVATDAGVSNPFTASGLTPNNEYAFYVQADCGDGTSEWVGPFTFLTYGDCSSSGTYDYANNFDASNSVGFVANTPGDYITITFTAGSTETCCDDWFIMDAADGTGNVIATGAGDITGSYESITGEISFYVDSDGSVTGTTFEYSLSCAPPPACPDPTALTVTDITATSADLGWTEGGTESLWNIEIVDLTAGDAATGVATDTGVSNPFTASGLTPNNEYAFYVQADCGDGTSEWVGPMVFTTACGIFTPVYLQDFTTITPNCWDEADNGDATTGPLDTGNSSWIADGFLNNGFSGAYKINLWQAAKSDWLLSPTFDLTGGPFQVEFDFGIMEWGSSTTAGILGSDDVVELMITIDNGSTWTILQTFDASTVVPASGTHIVQDLTAYSGTTAQFGIRGSEGTVDDTNDNDVFVDNFLIRPIPACPDPTSLTVTNITATSADVTWSAGGSETQWNYVVQPAGTGTPTSGTTVGSTTVSETDLTPQTDYEVYIQAICGENTGDWVGPVFFTTPPQTNFVLDCVNGGPQTLTYCYENNDTNVFTFTSADGTTPINLTFNEGQVEDGWDELVVLDSDGITDLNAATPYGTGGDVSGLTFQSTGSSISFQVQADGVFDCGSEGYTSITVTASCATCINPTATFVVVDDCENGDQFLVDVNITSLGDATSLSVQDNQGNPAVSVSTTGSITPLFGPYSFNTDIVFTVSNEQDANCVITSQSISLAACPPANDNPCNATIAVVNSDETCTEVNPGTLLEATDSGYPNGSCTTSADDDVWYQFTAVGDQQIIQILNVVGGDFFTSVDHAVYEGTDCNNLTQLYCTTDDFSLTPALTVGETYYIRVFSSGTAPTSITFDLCIQTLGEPTYCLDALPICPDLPDPFPNVSDGSIAPPYLDYGCLFTQPNPYWNTINVDVAGDYTFTLEQTSTTGNLIDIDFIVWGPFTAQDTGCYELLPENIEDCSYSATATETVEITGAPAGSIYVILITNYNGADGTYTFSQEIGPTDGINCDVVCDVTLDYDGIIIEQGTTAPEGQSDDINLCGYTSVTLTADTVYDVDSYDWYVDGIYQDGVNSPTFVATQSGSYQCIVGGGICAEFTSSITANINIFQDPDANQAPDLEACDNGTGIAAFDLESQTEMILGTQSEADFVVTYHETLTDAQAGIGALSSPYSAEDDTVIFVRVEDINAVGSMSGCASTNTSFNLIVDQEFCEIIPQGISPNNDGLNDNFDVSSFDVQRLEIYNRYGTLVYSKDNYTNEWHGQSNDGDELPVGTYYFVMKYQGTKQKAAWVYINR